MTMPVEPGVVDADILVYAINPDSPTVLRPLEEALTQTKCWHQKKKNSEVKFCHGGY